MGLRRVLSSRAQLGQVHLGACLRERVRLATRRTCSTLQAEPPPPGRTLLAVSACSLHLERWGSSLLVPNDSQSWMRTHWLCHRQAAAYLQASMNHLDDLLLHNTFDHAVHGASENTHLLCFVWLGLTWWCDIMWPLARRSCMLTGKFDAAREGLCGRHQKLFTRLYWSISWRQELYWNPACRLNQILSVRDMILEEREANHLAGWT